VPLFLVTLPLKSRRNSFDFGGFRVLHVLDVEAQDLQFRELYVRWTVRCGVQRVARIRSGGHGRTTKLFRASSAQLVGSRRKGKRRKKGVGKVAPMSGTHCRRLKHGRKMAGWDGLRADGPAGF
jgi:hypothetical protein